MKFPQSLAKMGLARQTLILCGVLFFVVAAAFVGAVDYFIRSFAESAAIQDARHQMSLSSGYIERAYGQASERALQEAQRFIAALPGPLALSVEEVNSGESRLPAVMAGKTLLNRNIALLEGFRDTNAGSEPAIIMLHKGRIWRASTVLKYADGHSMAGSFYLEDDPAAQAFRSGKSQTFVVFRRGTFFATSLVPIIKDAAGNTLVAATVRIDLTADLAALKVGLAESKIGRTGDIFAVGHPSLASHNEIPLTLHPTTSASLAKVLFPADPGLASALPILLERSKLGESSMLELPQFGETIFATPVKNWNWVLVGVAKSAEIFGAARKFSLQLIAASTLAALALGGMIALGIRTALAKLSPASDALRRIGQGDFTARAPTGPAGSLNELDILAAEINDAGESLGRLSSSLGMAQRQLVQSEKLASIGQLAAGVAHEINNPIGFVASNLGAIENYTNDLLKIALAAPDAIAVMPEGLPRSEFSRIVQEADPVWLAQDIPSLLLESRDGIERVKKIVLDLKDFSRPESPDAQWQLADVVRSIRSTVTVARNEIKYCADVIDLLPDQIEAECLPSTLNQVFLNLLVNAAHAVESRMKGAGRGQITLRAGTRGDSAWFDFADDGCGMDAPTLTRIFDPFFTTKPVGKGTGLGLSIAHGIVVERHHGKLSVTSTVGKGTTFTIEIPLRQRQTDTHGALAEAA